MRLGVRAPVAFQLRLDPVDRGSIAIGPLPPIAELRQSLDRRLVAIEIQPRDERRNRVGRGCRRRLRAHAERGRCKCENHRQRTRPERDQLLRHVTPCVRRALTVRSARVV